MQLAFSGPPLSCIQPSLVSSSMYSSVIFWGNVTDLQENLVVFGMFYRLYLTEKGEIWFLLGAYMHVNF